MALVDLAVSLHLPRFMDYLTHNALAHPAHHMLPAIPFHRLREAQDRLVQLLGSRIVTTRPLHVPGTFRRCKLYDFERHCWLDFSGRPTTAPIALPPGTGPSAPRR